MKRFRIVALLFVISIACRPTESQTTDRQPRQGSAPIPPTVSAARRTPVVMVAHNVLPAVVNIQTESTIRRREVDPFFDPFGLFGGRDNVYHQQSLGSGFVWSSDGIIVTNNHVVEGASSITVNFNDGTQLKAKLIGVDPDSDVAVLRVSANNLVTAPIGISSDLMIGETVVAVGNPFGLSGSVTTGVVSALGRSVPSKEQGRTYTDFIQTDASINPGNSGGPLLNIEGKVIGINTAIYAQAQGIGFAIPVDRAKKVIQDLLRFGQVHTAWIGAVTSTLTPEEARRTGAKVQHGAVGQGNRAVGGALPADRADRDRRRRVNEIGFPDVEPGNRLVKVLVVEEHEFGIADQRLRELRALAHPGREPADGPEARLVEGQVRLQARTGGGLGVDPPHLRERLQLLIDAPGVAGRSIGIEVPAQADRVRRQKELTIAVEADQRAD